MSGYPMQHGSQKSSTSSRRPFGQLSKGQAQLRTSSVWDSRDNAAKASKKQHRNAEKRLASAMKENAQQKQEYETKMSQQQELIKKLQFDLRMASESSDRLAEDMQVEIAGAKCEKEFYKQHAHVLESLYREQLSLCSKKQKSIHGLRFGNELLLQQMDDMRAEHLSRFKKEHQMRQKIEETAVEWQMGFESSLVHIKATLEQKDRKITELEAQRDKYAKILRNLVDGDEDDLEALLEDSSEQSSEECDQQEDDSE